MTKSRKFLDHLTSILGTSHRFLTNTTSKMDEKEVIKGIRSSPEAEMPSPNEKFLRIAHLEIGNRESPGLLNNNRIVEYHKYATLLNEGGQPDSVPWCSSFVCFAVEKAGEKSTNSMAARSWLKWGVSSLHDPAPGDIVVFWRGSKTSWRGHVGFFLRRHANGSIMVLGGNQNDEVNITLYSDKKLLGIRRCKSMEVVSPKDEAVLSFLSHSMINGKLIGKSTKVV